MKTLLAAFGLATALTGAAHAGPYDTSEMTVDDKSTLAVVISNYNVHCSRNGMLPKIRVFYDQLMSEVDDQSAAMDAAKKDFKSRFNWEGQSGWCQRRADYMQTLNNKLVEAPPPVDLAFTTEGRNAFLYVSLQRHEATCPMARSQAFEIARKAMITRGSKELENVSPEIIVWAGKKFEKEVGTTVEAGLSGEWCRSMTATITAYQRMMFE